MPERQDRARTSVLPFIIAVTGKRMLGEHETAVRETLRTMFDRIDERCGATGKILLTGLAIGADTLAAEEAAQRSDWSVMPVLPLEQDLYEQDFEEAEKVRFRRLLSLHGRRKIVLAPLRESPGGASFQPSRLVRGAVNPERTLHYEQLGLYLARHAGLLIAVKEANEGPGKVGGTARVVASRLGEIDDKATDVLDRSDELAAAPQLGDRLVGPLWLVDLGCAVDAGPAQRFKVRFPDGGWELADNALVERSLAVAAWIDQLNQRAAELPAAQQPRDDEDPARILSHLRNAVATIARRDKARVERLVKALALQFFLAVLSYEIYVELKSYVWPGVIGFYLIFVSLAVALYLWAVRRSWQFTAENYRALAEAMRVQLLWWDAGCREPRDRVDNQFLQEAPPSLLNTRLALSQAINFAKLARRFAAPDTQVVERWITSQLDFFGKRIAEREAAIERVEHASWFLFWFGLSNAVCLTSAEIVPASFHPVREVGTHAILAAGALILAGLMWFASRSLGAFAHEGHDTGTKWWKNGLGVVFAFTAGIAVAVILVSIAEMLPLAGAEHGTEEGAGEAAWHLAKEMMAMATILPAAFAGALRFVTEKLSKGAELTGYQEASARLRRGAAALARSGIADERRSHIIRELGIGALRENEAWLRAHRERPLEPVLGG